jgi:hypothetical protein
MKYYTIKNSDIQQMRWILSIEIFLKKVSYQSRTDPSLIFKSFNVKISYQHSYTI